MFEPQYNAKEHEEEIYKLWEDSGYFNPDNLPQKDGKPYTIIMPPLNANGELHVGHGLFLTLEDILIRYQRMRGRRALWLPGTDHAGFETQVVFEKKLEKEGKSRFGMKREEFYKQVFEFTQRYKKLTEAGIRRMGASCDWSRNIFTLDPRIVEIVYDTFERMWKDDLVYRGERICNWCPKHQTALSDLETKYEEREDVFYYLKYGPFTIGTARPETKFGDKYVVMHPDDKRYKDFKHGQALEIPDWINGPITATVIKDDAVDITFGTGVMTITPWHDAADFEIAKRHKLDVEQIIDKAGKLLPIAGEFSGMHISKARPLIVEKLKAKGLLDKAKTDLHYKHNVQICYKCKTVIEPQIIPQWYVAVTKSIDGKPSLRDAAMHAVNSKQINIIPDRFEKVFMHWMEELRDWPISRQIWWGIQIPVKYCTCGEIIVDTKNEIVACPKCKSSELTQDPDTFDTWFSSGQWPYATLLAHSKKDFETYYSTSVMETGWDILFFWVARMVMLGLYRTGKIPFETVYLHGLVRDKDRQKMSKSKGNVVDPLGVIDLYGTDALRFALVFSTAAGNDIPLDEQKIKGMKHFANKLWNIARFVAQNAGSFEGDASLSPATDADRELLAELARVKEEVTKHLDVFEFHEAAQSIYHFTWHHFADLYIEASKKQLADDALKENTKKLLSGTLVATLKLLHPFMPFVTETIYQKLQAEKLLMIESW